MKIHNLLTAALLVAGACGQVRMTTAKALQLAFPKCEVKRQTITLTDAQKARVGKMSGRPFKQSMAFPYMARRNGKLIGTAWFDVHKVRSKKQLLMVVVDPQQRVQRVELLAFAEPKNYRPPPRWLLRFRARQVGKVRAGRDVPRIAGSTLTVRATTRCVNRILALHRVVYGPPPAKAGASHSEARAQTEQPRTNESDPEPKKRPPTRRTSPSAPAP